MTTFENICIRKFTCDYAGIKFLEKNYPYNHHNLTYLTLVGYTDYFEIKYNSDSSQWYINILKSLEDNLLHKDPELVITLTASESGNVNTGKSALVLRLPVASIDEAPIFSEAYYSAKYSEDDTKIIEFENSITFTNIDDPSKVSITLDSKYTLEPLHYYSDYRLAIKQTEWINHQ